MQEVTACFVSGFVANHLPGKHFFKDSKELQITGPILPLHLDHPPCAVHTWRHLRSGWKSIFNMCWRDARHHLLATSLGATLRGAKCQRWPCGCLVCTTCSLCALYTPSQNEVLDTKTTVAYVLNTPHHERAQFSKGLHSKYTILTV
jgi:hypothetical protein